MRNDFGNWKGKRRKLKPLVAEQALDILSTRTNRMGQLTLLHDNNLLFSTTDPEELQDITRNGTSDGSTPVQEAMSLWPNRCPMIGGRTEYWQSQDPRALIRTAP